MRPPFQVAALALVPAVLIGCGTGTPPPPADHASRYGDESSLPAAASAEEGGPARVHEPRHDGDRVSAQQIPEEEPPHAVPEAATSDAERQPWVPGDQFEHREESPFASARDTPYSTFSIDVDTASYAKVRRYLNSAQLPPADAVRIEEFVNYFEYDYPSPENQEPFAAHVEVAEAPWQPAHRLVRVGIKARETDGSRPPSNLVFLIDVSGSMDYADRLPLVKHGLQMLATQLNERDRVSIVVYAGAAGLVLPATPGSQRVRIINALDRLRAGGSTNGAAGIELAYALAREHLIPGGNNRVILCSDGDFNVGRTDAGGLIQLARRNSRHGVYLTVLGFGTGNHNDAMMEQLSNQADGTYAFIDSQREARKVLLDQLQQTLVTIARDVKIQIEFNPAHVEHYRLIGYENRRLADEDFNNDRKDAGEVGAGHSVTALYEVVPVGEGRGPAGRAGIDPFRYQGRRPMHAQSAGELLHLKIRYKPPQSETSRLMTLPVRNQVRRFSHASPEFRFAAAVASFGMLLRDSPYAGQSTYASVREIAQASRGADRFGHRREFVELVTAAERLAMHTRSSTAAPRQLPRAPASYTTLPDTEVGPAGWTTLPDGEVGPPSSWTTLPPSQSRVAPVFEMDPVAVMIVVGVGWLLLCLTVGLVIGLRSAGCSERGPGKP